MDKSQAFTAMLCIYGWAALCTALFVARLFRRDEKGAVIAPIFLGLGWPIGLPLFVMLMRGPPWRLTKGDRR